jgi:predicted lipoprotein with Yx(FWY)xxD motif
MKTLLVLMTVVGALAATGTGTAMPDSPIAVQPGRSAYGSILFDGRGFVVYAFTADSSRASRCAGACAKAWPPFIVKMRPVAAQGLAQKLVGRVRRSDGSYQATYAGHPLYYYVGDRKPGQILCQNAVEFGGRWLVVGRNGSLIR